MATTKNKQNNILEQGFDALLKKLGPDGAGEFMRAFSKGKGDSVKEYNALWKGKGLDDIDKTLQNFRKKRTSKNQPE